MEKYVVEIAWDAYARDMNFSLHDLLRYAQLPADFFTRKPLKVTADEFFKLWRGIEFVMQDIPAFPLQIGKALTPETFGPPLYATLHSRNLIAALTRMAKYKPLVGPARFNITQTSDHGTINIVGITGYEQLPPTMIAAELVFWVQVARMATRERISPQIITITSELPHKKQYEDYFGCPIIRGDSNGMTFSAADLNKPFLTANAQMLSIFEPILEKRLQDITKDSKFRDQVRACLVEVLASGDYSMSDVASRLSISTRTLQRRLKQENTSFQKELDCLREELARHYLSNSDYTSNQIAFLLGYDEPTSFFRAFRGWTGQTPEYVRTAVG